MTTNTGFFTDDFGTVSRIIYVDIGMSFEAGIYPLKENENLFTFDAVGRKAGKAPVVFKHRDDPLSREQVVELINEECSKFFYREVVQPGRTPVFEAGCRTFKSFLPCQHLLPL